MRRIPSETLAAEPPSAAGTFTWGWGWLDRKLGTALPGDILVVAARDNVGKSFMALHLVHEMARRGQPASYVSIEDGPARVRPRLAAGLAHPALSVAFPEGASLSETLAVMSETAEDGGVCLIDYLQEIQDDTGSRTGDPVVDIGTIFRKLKRHALENGVPVVVVAQVAPPSQGEDPYEVPSRYRIQQSPSLVNRQATNIVMMGVEPDRQHVVVELAKGKDVPVGARTRLARGPGGRLVKPLRPDVELEEAGLDNPAEMG